MPESESQNWGLFPRIIVAAIAAMVLSLALKPYESRLVPYVKKIKNSTIANINLDESTTRRSANRGVISQTHPTHEKVHSTQDGITEKDKTQLKNLLEKY